jgi:type IV secretory pathway VirB2 component (pilin)
VRFVLTLIAAVLYGIGWVAGKVSLLLVWCWVALAVGWDEARAVERPVAGVR